MDFAAELAKIQAPFDPRFIRKWEESRVWTNSSYCNCRRSNGDCNFTPEEAAAAHDGKTWMEYEIRIAGPSDVLALLQKDGPIDALNCQDRSYVEILKPDLNNEFEVLPYRSYAIRAEATPENLQRIRDIVFGGLIRFSSSDTWRCTEGRATELV
jgi:hypothetical protein